MRRRWWRMWYIRVIMRRRWWLTCVARLRTCCTSSCVSVGRLRKSLTMAVRSWSWTCVFSSWNPSRNDSRSSSALSIRSAYSPMIQIIDALKQTTLTVIQRHNHPKVREPWSESESFPWILCYDSWLSFGTNLCAFGFGAWWNFKLCVKCLRKLWFTSGRVMLKFTVIGECYKLHRKPGACACTNRASGSSSVSRFSQSVEMILSYLFGYFRKISCK